MNTETQILGKLLPTPEDINTCQMKDFFHTFSRMHRALKGWQEAVAFKIDIKVHKEEDRAWLVALMQETSDMTDQFEFIFTDDNIHLTDDNVIWEK